LPCITLPAITAVMVRLKRQPDSQRTAFLPFSHRAGDGWLRSMAETVNTMIGC
jgi:hypothetical protein